MSETNEDVVSDPVPIMSAKPFFGSAKAYLKAGWLPIPLEVKGKRPAADGYTGKKNKYPDGDKARADFAIAFKDHPDVSKAANVGIWLADNVIGIDIDDYPDKDGKPKNGWKQYLDLVEQLGELPATWVSSARSEGRSGIRFYRIPKGLSWSGRAALNIDVIQLGHRFAVVAPSVHPELDGALYKWYSPEDWDKAFQRRDSSGLGQSQPTLDEDKRPVGVPMVEELPDLPDKWVDYLTRGRVKATSKLIDMDSTWTEVEDWYKKYSRQGDMCRSMKKYLKTAKKSIDEQSASHDPLLAGHYSIILAGTEGHSGSIEAKAALERYWLDSIKERDKRGGDEAGGELFRSYSGAMRIAKARIQEMIDAGANPTKSTCRCTDLSEIKGDSESLAPSSLVVADEPTGGDDSDDAGKGPADFDRNDDGNAAYLHHIYGENLKWVHDMKLFIHWNNKRWEFDTEKHLKTRRAFQVVKEQQKAYALSLMSGVAAAEENLMLAQAADDGGIGDAREELKAVKGNANAWMDWAQRSGNVAQQRNALDAYSTAGDDVSISFEKLNNRSDLLACANGAVELGEQVSLRPMEREDYITLNTNHEYFEGGLREMRKKGGDIAEGVRLWEDYLDTFIPDLKLRLFIQKVMGYALWGGNQERIIVFLYGTTSTGKSVFLSAIENALGEYASAFPLSVFKTEDEKNPILINLKDKRVITASEVGVAEALSESIIKRLVGDDKAVARYLNSNETKEITLKALPIIATNTPPNIPNTDAGLARRLMVIPFDHQARNTIKGNDKKNAMLKVSGPAVLSWMVDGWLMYKKEGIQREEWPVQIEDSTKGFTEDLSEFGSFWKDCIMEVEYLHNNEDTRRDTSMSLDQVHKLYTKWAERRGEEPIGQRALSRKLAGHNIKLTQGRYLSLIHI